MTGVYGVDQKGFFTGNYQSEEIGAD